MKFSDEQLMAFADGELGAEERAAIEAAQAKDPEIARRIEHYRAQRDLLRRSFDDVLNEPVPERLATTARTAPMGASNVIGLEGARAMRSKAMPRVWSWPQWTAIAASLLVGLIVGQTMLASRDAPLLAARDGGLVAGGDLAAALTNQASFPHSTLSPEGAERVPEAGEGAIAIGLTYRAKSGEYCRTFTVTRDAAFAGIACREDEAWAMRVLSRIDASAATAGEYRMAGAELPPIVLQAVEAHIAGNPLDAAEENAARRTEWRE